jgi:hypothetical protein
MPDDNPAPANTIFPFKVEIAGRGVVTPPGGIRPNGERVPLLNEQEHDNGSSR